MKKEEIWMRPRDRKPSLNKRNRTEQTIQTSCHSLNGCFELKMWGQG
jgi:hypothetical protein